MDITHQYEYHTQCDDINIAYKIKDFVTSTNTTDFIFSVTVQYQGILDINSNGQVASQASILSFLNS